MKIKAAQILSFHAPAAKKGGDKVLIQVLPWKVGLGKGPFPMPEGFSMPKGEFEVEVPADVKPHLDRALKAKHAAFAGEGSLLSII